MRIVYNNIKTFNTMKNPTIIITLLLLTAVSVNGQNDTAYQYQSVFGQHYSEWITAIIYNENGESYGSDLGYYSITGEESHFEGYHPIQCGWAGGINGWGSYIAGRGYYSDGYDTDGTYYLREDESHARLYMHKFDDGDILLMDLDLNVGDTFFWTRMDGHLVRPCVVDSVFYDEGRKHVRLDHTVFICADRDWTLKPIKLEFIEGVGPNLSPFYCLDLDNLFTALLCFSKDSVSEYGPLPIFNNRCIFDNPYDDAIGEVESGRIGIWMNPETGILTLSCLPEQGNSITLCDISGRTLLQTASRGGTKQLNIASLPPQVYIVTVRNDTFAQTFKILKP